MQMFLIMAVIGLAVAMHVAEPRSSAREAQAAAPAAPAKVADKRCPVGQAWSARLQRCVPQQPGGKS